MRELAGGSPTQLLIPISSSKRKWGAPQKLGLCGFIFKLQMKTAALILLLAAICVPAAAADTDLHQAERQIFDLANQARKDAGVEPLHWNEHAAEAARVHAKLMAEKQALSHQFPGEPPLRERL